MKINNLIYLEIQGKVSSPPSLCKALSSACRHACCNNNTPFTDREKDKGWEKALHCLATFIFRVCLLASCCEKTLPATRAQQPAGKQACLAIKHSCPQPQPHPASITCTHAHTPLQALSLHALQDRHGRAQAETWRRLEAAPLSPVPYNL